MLTRVTEVRTEELCYPSVVKKYAAAENNIDVSLL
jgi:hypothetical protein